MTISQYVLTIVAIAELVMARIFHVIPFFRSKLVLMATARIVEKYFSPFNPCIPSFSSIKRRRHYKNREQVKPYFHVPDNVNGTRTKKHVSTAEYLKGTDPIRNNCYNEVERSIYTAVKAVV